MLFTYRQQVQRLLPDPAQARFNLGDLDNYINLARGQLAGESECIRVYATLNVDNTAQQYPFSAITFPSSTDGVAGVLNIRMATYNPFSSGQLMIEPREWEYFNTFVLSDPQPTPGPPSVWTQFGQGVNGTIFLNVLDLAYTLSLDTVCYPVPLTTDSTTEAIPYLWTDAVPYFAAYLALLSQQQAELSKNMYELYKMFTARARAIATPSVLGHQYSQGLDPEMANRLAVNVRAAD